MGRFAKLERIAATIEADIRGGRTPFGDALASLPALVLQFSVTATRLE